MNVNMHTSLALATNNPTDTVGLAVLKKALNIEAQGALALIDAIPAPPQASSANLPPNLGRNIDVTA